MAARGIVAVKYQGMVKLGTAMDGIDLNILQDFGLAGIIALGAWWALREVFKRIDRSQDQTDKMLEKIDTGLRNNSENSGRLAAAITAASETQHREVMTTLERIEENQRLGGNK